ncbi:FAD-dependent oxidoreductase [Nocardioides sp. YJ-D4]
MSTTPSPAAPTVAVVGSGPSGCYAAQMVRKQWPDAVVTVFDRLPAPFGLLRYGVAPDHQHTKRLAHQFSRVLTDEGTRFAGNVSVGRDVSLEVLEKSYHAVVLAVGLSGDRSLAVPGCDLDGVYGAGRIMRWVNAHPDEAMFEPTLGERTVIVGNGNVAVDALRMLIKRDHHFTGSDLAERAWARLGAKGPNRIDVVGRSALEQARFDAAMIRELGALEHVRFEVVPDEVHVAGAAPNARADAIHELVASSRPDADVTVRFRFGWTPRAVLGDDRVEAMSFTRNGDAPADLSLQANSVVTAIGFTAHPDGGLFELAPEDGDADRVRLRPGVYACGWFRRGSTGSIPDNRTCAKTVVSALTEDLEQGVGAPKPGFDGLPPDVREKAVDVAGWQRIDAAETATADQRRVRHKIADLPGLLAAARQDGPDTNRPKPQPALMSSHPDRNEIERIRG